MATPAHAADHAFMPRGIGEVNRPNQFADFCRRFPDQCTLPWSPAAMRTMQVLNDQTAGSLTPTPDKGPDHWDISFWGPADCEDFALTLRMRLRAAYPGHQYAFRIATAYTEQKQYHAVLTVETGGGTWVCDQRYPNCQPWFMLPYNWRLREEAGDKWQVLGPCRDVEGEPCSRGAQ